MFIVFNGQIINTHYVTRVGKVSYNDSDGEIELPHLIQLLDAECNPIAQAAFATAEQRDKAYMALAWQLTGDPRAYANDVAG